MRNKIIALSEVIEEELEITYSLGIHMRPIALIKRLQDELAVKITFIGKDSSDDIQEVSVEQPLILMTIGYPLDSERNPNKLKVKIEGEHAARAMEGIRVLMASKFGLEPIFKEIPKTTSKVAIVNALEALRANNPTSKIVLENNRGVSLSQNVNVDNLDRMNFFDASSVSVFVEDKKASKIIEEFNSLLVESNKKAIEISGKDVLNRGNSNYARLVFLGNQPSLLDDMNYEIKEYSEEEYNLAIQKAEGEISRAMSACKKDSTEWKIWDSHLEIVRDKTISYNKLLRGDKTNVAKELILKTSKMVRQMKTMGMNSEKTDDVEESIMCILKHLGVGHFNTNYDELMAQEAEKGKFVLVSNKFPYKSASIIGKTIVGFIGLSGCELSVRSHPVLIAAGARVPVVITKLSLEEIMTYMSVALLVDRDKRTMNIIFDPSHHEQKAAIELGNVQAQQLKEERDIIRSQPNTDKNGKDFPISVNIGSVGEAEEFIEQGGHLSQPAAVKIGLARTEFLYGDEVNSHDFLVNAAEQSRIIREFYEMVGLNVSVRIRGLDHSDDKESALIIPDNYYKVEPHIRGRLIFEANKDIYRAFVRATIDAAIAAGRNEAEVLFPMVNSVEHAELIRNLVISEGGLLEGEDELLQHLVSHDGKPSIKVNIGAMVEDKILLSNPGLLSEILSLVDFINIGTNDFGGSIGQDRKDQEKLVAYNPLEWFMYKGIIQEALAKGKSPCVCGGLAGDLGWSYLFSALGASVSPSLGKLHSVKKELINSRFDKLPELEAKIINNTAISELITFVAEKMNISKDEIVSSPMLVAQFYEKLVTLDQEEHDVFRGLMDKASVQMESELLNFL